MFFYFCTKHRFWVRNKAVIKGTHNVMYTHQDLAPFSLYKFKGSYLHGHVSVIVHYQFL